MSKRIPVSFAFALALAVLFHGATPVLATGELIGAKAVIARVSGGGAVPEKTVTTELTGLTKLYLEVEKYKTETPKLAPEESAARWLALVDGCLAVPPQERMMQFNAPDNGGTKTASLADVAAALPGPAAWPALHARVKADEEAKKRPVRVGAGLTLLTSLLVGDRPGARAAIDRAEVASPAEDYMLPQVLQSLKSSLAQAEANSSKENYLKYLRQLASGDGNISLPDFADIIGEEDAEAFLTETLTRKPVAIRIQSGGKTAEIAARAALKNIDRVLVPQWNLVNGRNAVTLFEAMNRRFPSGLLGETLGQPEKAELPRDSDFSSALVRYTEGLILAGRTEEAAKLVEKASRGTFERSFSGFHATAGINRVDIQALLKFWRSMALKKDGAAYFQVYKRLALATGEYSALASETKTLLASGKAEDRDHLELRVALMEAFFASDRIEEGFGEAKILLASKELMTVQESGGNRELNGVGIAAKLLKVGDLTGKRGISDLAVNYLVAAGERELESGFNIADGGWRNLNQITAALRESKRFAEAEGLLLKAMEKTKALLTYSATPFDGNLGNYLSELLEIYDASERHSDVITLLEEAPWWVGEELADISGYNVFGPAARALHAGGRDMETDALLNASLFNQSMTFMSPDEIYSLLAEIEGEKLLATLDLMQKRYPYEERPLIWKASILLKAGKPDEAEAAARQALKIDPTDGETKAGERVLGYKVLGEVLAAKGKKEDAEFFARVVQAVRVAEKGDEYLNAGLIDRSLTAFEEAEKLFGDAYCVQWRLGERFRAKGDMEGAKVHYRKAFERMPEQFGRVASFCFGCEGAFANDTSRGVADEVLTALEKTMPEKPQVHYMLGILRESQGKFPEAAEKYARALELDPEYLDALNKLVPLAQKTLMPLDKRDALLLASIRLDPAGMNSGRAVILDLKTMWETLEKYPPPELPKAEFPKIPLTAAKAELAKNPAYLMVKERYGNVRFEQPAVQSMTPAESLNQNPLIGGAFEIIDGNGMYETMRMGRGMRGVDMEE